VQDGEQRVQRPADGEVEQLLLAGDMVVDGRLGDAEAAGQLLHAGAVVSAFVEDGDGDLQQRVAVVARSATTPAFAALPRSHDANCRTLRAGSFSQVRRGRRRARGPRAARPPGAGRSRTVRKAWGSE